MKKKKQVLMKTASLRTLVQGFFVVFVILPVAIYSVVSFFVFQNFALDSYTNTLQETTRTMETQLEKTMDKYEDASLTAYYGGYVDKLEKGLDESGETELQSFLSGICYSYSDVSAAIICTEDAVYYQGGELTVKRVVEQMQAYQPELDQEKGSCVWYPMKALSYQYADDYRYVMARALRSKDYDTLGYLYVVLNAQMVSTPLRQATRGMETVRYLVDEKGEVLYATQTLGENEHFLLSEKQLEQSEGSCSLTVNGESSLVVWQTLEVAPWKLVCSYPRASMMSSLYHVWKILAIFVCVCFACAFLLILLLNRLVYKPINGIIESMNRFAKGDMLVRLSGNSVSEVCQLSEHFNSMTGKMQRLLKENEIQLREKNEYKIKALLAQLNPHFIYNTLNTIKWMAAISRQTKIQHTAESLMKILMSVTKKQGVYRIEDEIELIQAYADIQRVRFSNFNLVWNVQPEALTCIIPVYIIQPIIENAIVHGLGSGKVLDGVVSVDIWLDGNLNIKVSDNGSGFDVEKWKKEGDAAAGDHLHIGIHNIEQIIQLEYGSGYGITVESQPEEGTTVRYLLPACKEVQL